MSITPQDVLAFWRDAGGERWWKSDPAFDQEIIRRFQSLHQDAAEGRLAHWHTDSYAALALIIILDQFSRNIYRGEPRAFACDPQAREAASQSILKGFDLEHGEEDRIWFYVPFEHSENLADQALSVKYFTERTTSRTFHKFITDHAQVIERFGRFPHRNAILGRTSTPEEQKYLASDQSTGWGQRACRGQTTKKSNHQPDRRI